MAFTLTLAGSLLALLIAMIAFSSRAYPNRHTWRRAVRRNPYALVWAPRLGEWVRVYELNSGDVGLMTLDGQVMDGQSVRCRREHP